MQSYTGSGIYTRVFTNGEIYSDDDCNTLSQRMVDSMSLDPYVLEFSSKSLFMLENYYFNVKMPSLNVVDKLYRVENIFIEMLGDYKLKYIYRCSRIILLKE